MPTAHAEEINEILYRFYRAFHIPASIYEDNELVQACVPFEFEPDLGLCCLQFFPSSKSGTEPESEISSDSESESVRYMGKEPNSAPESVQYIRRNGIYFGRIPVLSTQLAILIGPTAETTADEDVCRAFIRDMKLPPACLSDLMYWFRKVPRLDHSSFRSVLHFLDTVINKRNTTSGETDMAPAKVSSLQASASEFVDHNSSSFEEEALSLVTSGQPQKLLELLQNLNANPEISMGQTSRDSLRSLKNAFIASVTLTSRAAVRGGLSYEYALNLSDFYIRRVEMMDSQDKILPFLGQMMMDYCERVMDLSLPERASPLTQAAIREIRADLREKLTVETLAETLHCSRSSLSHTFSREMKMSVSNYITICKIEEAKRLLKQGLRISETAQELGFSSQTHFQNVFRRVTGTTPANFQKHPSFIPSIVSSATSILL